MTETHHLWFRYHDQDYYISAAGFEGPNWMIRAVGVDLSHLEVLGSDMSIYAYDAATGARLSAVYPEVRDEAAAWSSRLS